MGWQEAGLQLSGSENKKCLSVLHDRSVVGRSVRWDGIFSITTTNDGWRRKTKTTVLDHRSQVLQVQYLYVPGAQLFRSILMSHQRSLRILYVEVMRHTATQPDFYLTIHRRHYVLYPIYVHGDIRMPGTPPAARTSRGLLSVAVRTHARALIPKIANRK